MRIGIDAQLTVGTATGIGEYVRGLIEALRLRGTDVVDFLDEKLDPWRFDRRVFWDQVILAQRARASEVDVLHCASGTMPLNVPMPVVVTVHDVAWLRVQAHARPYARYYFGKFAVERYRSAAAIAVDSAFSRGELLDVVPSLDPERVVVVYPGVAEDFAAVARGRGDGRTILVVGTVERRKNIQLIIDALPFLEDARVVSVGPFTPYREECEMRAASLGVYDRVEFRGYVPRAELLELYASSAVAALPSTYEGFGYGAAQALCAGIPLVASDRASLPEIVAGDAPTLSVDELTHWVDALRAALNGEYDERAALARTRARERFAWAASADSMMRVYEGVM
jgi:glycosyltransferase involved in cell wall biosynthesis